MEPDGSGAKRLTTAPGTGDAFVSSWSPDGHRIAFGAGGGLNDLWVVDADGRNEHLIDEGAFVGGANWSPDGRWMAWLHASTQIDALDRFVIADADGSHQRAFLHEGVPRHWLTYDELAPAVSWSVDARWAIGILTASDGDTVNRLLMIDPVTGQTRTVDALDVMSFDQQRLAP